jgi:hypothetical protein
MRSGDDGDKGGQEEMESGGIADEEAENKEVNFSNKIIKCENKIIIN